MIRVVVDTMIFVRGLINPHGLNAQLLNRLEECVDIVQATNQVRPPLVKLDILMKLPYGVLPT